MAGSAVAELFFTTNSNKFQGAHFVSSLLEKDSMWISGFDKMSNKVLWQINVPAFNLLLEKTIEDSKASSQIIMVSFRKQILFAEKGGSEIYGINTETRLTETVFKDVSFQIDAICCNEDHLYIFQKKRPDVIQILDSNFQSVGDIPTGFKENIPKCKVDLCTTTMTMSTSTQERSSSEFKKKYQHTCIISISKPVSSDRTPWYKFVPSVRTVNKEGVIWQVDSKKCPELDESFNPCSVTTSATGYVFIADNGANKVSQFLTLNRIVHIIGDRNLFKISEVCMFHLFLVTISKE